MSRSLVLSTEECISAHSFETEACANYPLWYLSEFRNPVISPDSSHCQYDFPMHYSLVLVLICTSTSKLNLCSHVL